jgi:hypothetical protein
MTVKPILAFPGKTRLDLRGQALAVSPVERAARPVIHPAVNYSIG